MTISNFLSAINQPQALSSSAKVLSDPSSNDFKLALQRWTDLNLQVPGAIVLVQTEDDILKTLNLALKNNVPFVPKSGGHSSWSTIGSEGIIIDLSNFKGISVDKSSRTVRVQSGVLNKEFIAALYEEGLCASLGGGNTIGVVPQALGGGLCALSHLCGNTSDNILSAKLITASGELIMVDSSTPDLLWALKGAGQFFGLVVEITFQAYDLSILGTDDGTVYTGMFIFDIAQVGDATKVLKILAADDEHNAAFLCVATTNPGSGQPCFLVMLIYFGVEADADMYLAPLKALKPVMTMGGMTKYTEVNNGSDHFCVKGGIKRFYLAGLPEFTATPWPKVAQVFVDLVNTCPDAKGGGYGFEFVSGKTKNIELDSAWAHHNVKLWVESLSWYTDPASGPEVDRLESEAIKIATEGVAKEEIHTYQNFSRESSLESRYGGKERIEKLQALKRKWDPTGVFTKQFL